MSDELTQLRARVAAVDETNRLLRLELGRLQALAGGAMTELSRREADTKPLVDEADMQRVFDSLLLRGLLYDADKPGFEAGWNAALHTPGEADKSQGET